MQMITIPPVQLSPITDTTATWQYLEGQTPVDFTSTLDGVAWSAEALIENCGRVMWRGPVTLDASGFIEISVPWSASSAIRSDRRIDARLQITLTAPLPDLSQFWIAPVVILEVTQ